jgi:hypothetical protein
MELAQPEAGCVKLSKSGEGHKRGCRPERCHYTDIQ